MSEHGRSEFTAQQKADAVLRVLRGEKHTVLAKELNTSRERIARWESRFIEGGTSALSRRRRNAGNGGMSRILLWILAAAVLGGIAWMILRTSG
jgi:transposase-like protein